MKLFFIVILILITLKISAQSVSFTFDDGALGDKPNYTF